MKNYENSLYGRTIKQGPEGGRNLEDYEKWLNFKKEDLEGKIVLDLGAGEKIKFSKELEKSGVHATVVSMSPDFEDEKQRQLLKPSFLEKIKSKIQREERKMIVAGLGEQLPFKDDSFDEVLSLFSVSVYSGYKDGDDYEKWLPEIYRVLKPGGVGRIGPFHPPKVDMYDGDIFFKLRDKMKEFVKQTGYKHEFIPGLEKGQEVLIVHKDF